MIENEGGESWAQPTPLSVGVRRLVVYGMILIYMSRDSGSWFIWCLRSGVRCQNHPTDSLWLVSGLILVLCLNLDIVCWWVIFWTQKPCWKETDTVHGNINTLINLGCTHILNKLFTGRPHTNFVVTRVLMVFGALVIFGKMTTEMASHLLVCVIKGSMKSSSKVVDMLCVRKRLWMLFWVTTCLRRLYPRTPRWRLRTHQVHHWWPILSSMFWHDFDLFF